MTIHRLDEVLEAKHQPPRAAIPQQAVPGIRFIPRPCSCTWTLRLGAAGAVWTLAAANPGCKMHGHSSGGKNGESA